MYHHQFEVNLMNEAQKTKLTSGKVLFGIFFLLAPLLAQGGMGGMGQGMMQGTSNGSTQSDSVTVDQAYSRKLQTYVQDQHLQCMQCHAVSGAGIGPSLAAISARYLNRKDATKVLGERIANGFGRMPGGLASRQQAQELASLIKDLAGKSK